MQPVRRCASARGDQVPVGPKAAARTRQAFSLPLARVVLNANVAAQDLMLHAHVMLHIRSRTTLATSRLKLPSLNIS